MSPLELNKKILTFIGICAVEENAPFSKKIRVNLFFALMLLMNSVNTVVCSLYFVKYISIDYEGAIYGFLAGSCLVCLLYVLISLRSHSKKLRQIFEKLDEINQQSIIWLYCG